MFNISEVKNIQHPDRYKTLLENILKRTGLFQMYKEINRLKPNQDYIVKDSDRDKIIKLVTPYLQLNINTLSILPDTEILQLADEMFVIMNFLNLFAPENLLLKFMNILYNVIRAMDDKKLDFNSELYTHKMNKFYKINDDKFVFTTNITNNVLRPH